MIINYDFYYCKKCQESHGFDTSKEYSKLGPDCNTEMEFWANMDGDTDLAEQRKNQTPIVPSSKPIITCPTCQSTNISKIGTINRMVSTGLFGLASSKIGKTHKCNNCGTTW